MLESHSRPNNHLHIFLLLISSCIKVELEPPLFFPKEIRARKDHRNTVLGNRCKYILNMFSVSDLWIDFLPFEVLNL